MAVKKMKIDEFNGFGRRLMEVARDRGLGDPLSLAQAIHGNKKCREMVKLRKREDKDTDSPYDEVDGIKRIIQKHLTDKYADAYKVPSAYMYAYSIILDCSLDYLYGKTTVKSSNLEVADICKKTGLSEDTVKALMETTEADANNDSGFSLPAWWSDLMSGDSFYMIPMAWHSYADRIVQLYDIDKKVDTLKKTSEKEGIDSFLMNIQGMKADTLYKIRHEKEDSTMGAYQKMISCVEHFLNQYAEEWAAEQHPEYDEMYYRSEMNKLNIIESALKK